MKKATNLKQTRAPKYMLYAFLSLLLLFIPFTALVNAGVEGEDKSPESSVIAVLENGLIESELVESANEVIEEYMEVESWMTEPFDTADHIEVEDWMSSPF